MKETQLDKIKSHLRFLVDQYNFDLVGEQYSPEVMGNAFVKYLASTVGILVICDRHQVLTQIGLKSWPENEWFHLDDIVRFFYPNFEEANNFNKSIEEQLIYITSLFQGVCKPLILGDFSMQDQIREVERQRVKKMLRGFGIDHNQP